jgi:hypothetical protein
MASAKAKMDHIGVRLFMRISRFSKKGLLVAQVYTTPEVPVRLAAIAGMGGEFGIRTCQMAIAVAGNPPELAYGSMGGPTEASTVCCAELIALWNIHQEAGTSSGLFSLFASERFGDAVPILPPRFRQFSLQL